MTANVSFPTFGLDSLNFPNQRHPSLLISLLPIDLIQTILSFLGFQQLLQFRLVSRKCFWLGHDDYHIRMRIILRNCPPFRNWKEQEGKILIRQFESCQPNSKYFSKKDYLMCLICQEAVRPSVSLESHFQLKKTCPRFLNVSDKKSLIGDDEEKKSDLEFINQKIAKIIDSWLVHLKEEEIEQDGNVKTLEIMAPVMLKIGIHKTGSIWLHKETGAVVAIKGEETPYLPVVPFTNDYSKQIAQVDIQLGSFKIGEKEVYIFKICTSNFADWHLVAEKALINLQRDYRLKVVLANECLKPIKIGSSIIEWPSTK